MMQQQQHRNGRSNAHGVSHAPAAARDKQGKKDVQPQHTCEALSCMSPVLLRYLQQMQRQNGRQRHAQLGFRGFQHPTHPMPI